MPIKYVLVFAFLFLIYPPFNGRVMAADLNFICNKKCLLSPNQPLFNETNVKPGDYFTKSIKVINLRNESCALYLSLQSVYESDQTLACNLLTNITDTHLVLGSPFTSSAPQTTLKHLYLTKRVFLGNISANTQKTYDWTIYFNPLATNNLKGGQTKFNFDIGLECKEQPLKGEVLGVNNKSLQAIPITNYCPNINTLSATSTYTSYAVKDLNKSKISAELFAEDNLDSLVEKRISLRIKIVQSIIFYLQQLKDWLVGK